jgi:hypothetical protein
MLKGIEKFISEENGRFYLDSSCWNETSDIKIEEKDIINFTYNGKKYTAKTVACGNNSFGIFELNILKEV